MLSKTCFLENLQASDSFSRMFNIILIDQRQHAVLTDHIKLTHLVLIDPQAVTMFMGAGIIKCYFWYLPFYYNLYCNSFKWHHTSIIRSDLICCIYYMLLFYFISSVTVSHHIHGSPVYPGCANGGRAVQLQVYDTPSVHRRDPTEQ